MTCREESVKFDNMGSLRQTLREIVREKGTIAEVAKEVGFDRGNLLRMLREGQNPRIKTVLKIADGLGYTLTLKRKKGKGKPKKPSGSVW